MKKDRINRWYKLGFNDWLSSIYADRNALAPYQINDSLYVEIHSLTLQSFNYLKEVIDNTNRQTGFASLFSKPLTNVSTNLSNQNPKGSSVVGFFNVAAVAGRGKKFRQ